MKPLARKEGLETIEASDETIVYDVQRHRVHRLSPTAAMVWRGCDGRRTPAEIARSLPADVDDGAREELVSLALARLAKARLLEAGDAPPQLASRREALRRLGVAVALLPVVTSILAPTPTSAVSCFPPGTPCTTDAECCSGTCGSAIPGECD